MDNKKDNEPPHHCFLPIEYINIAFWVFRLLYKKHAKILTYLHETTFQYELIMGKWETASAITFEHSLIVEFLFKEN